MREKNSNSYLVFTRYGRVGEVGVTKKDYKPNASASAKDYEKKFKDKTSKKKGYNEIVMSFAKDDRESKVQKQEEVKYAPSKLN